MAIISCIGCSHALRIPDGRRGTVRCPHCRAEWSHPETIEFSNVDFRCSESGAQFNVISSRRSPLHKFVVQRIMKPMPETIDATVADPPSSSRQQALRSDALPLLPPVARGGGWLTRIVGRIVEVMASVPSAPVSTNHEANTIIPASTYDMDDYNWSGFSCPYCSASNIVSCPGGHLTCNGSVKLRNGRRFYQCFCGQAEFISGAIRTVEGARVSVGANVGARNPSASERLLQSGRPADTALPPPTRGLLAKQ